MSGRQSALEVLLVFLKLGLTSFGGPIAHIGYYRNEFVLRRRWLDEQAFVDLVGLCQFLPGPGSSQLGFSIGLIRAGYLGGIAAWIGFTLPSAILMVLFAAGVSAFDTPVGAGLLHGLKLVAVAIIAQAVWGMARALCPDRQRASIAVTAAVILLFSTSSLAQIETILLGAIAGLIFCRDLSGVVGGHFSVPVSRRAGALSLAMFLLVLFLLPAVNRQLAIPGLNLFDAFYRSGALVFGGGHVVLPLLRDAVVTPGWVNDDVFLSGYGLAQAIPGPLFSFSVYLGAVMSPTPHGLVGGAIALAAIFLPGFLILIGALPFWEVLRTKPSAQSMMRGINAAVVGLLGAALYNPVWTSSVKAPTDFGIALVGFIMLTAWRIPPLVVVVVLSALGGIATALPGN